MSGATPISPASADTTLAQDGQAAGAFSLADLRQMNDSASSLPTKSTQTASYTYVAADFGCLVKYNSASAGTFTIPASVFKADNVVFFRAIGTGQLTVAAGSGFTLTIPSTLTATPVRGATGAIHFDSPTTGTMM